jgi:hypothetical protein
MDLEMSSLVSIYKEKITRLYQVKERKTVQQVGCSGTTGPRRQKLDCSGTVAIVLSYNESVKDGSIAYQLQQNQEQFDALIRNLLQPMPVNVLKAIALLEKIFG